MTTTEISKRVGALCRLYRAGTISPEQEAELSRLESELDARRTPTPVSETIYDLPIARGMWTSDAREIER